MASRKAWNKAFNAASWSRSIMEWKPTGAGYTFRLVRFEAQHELECCSLIIITLLTGKFAYPCSMSRERKSTLMTFVHYPA